MGHYRDGLEHDYKPLRFKITEQNAYGIVKMKEVKPAEIIIGEGISSNKAIGEDLPNKFNYVICKDDPIVDAVIKKFLYRSKQGMKKYNSSMHDNNKPTLEWIEDAQEELMDGILYLQKLKEKLLKDKYPIKATVKFNDRTEVNYMFGNHYLEE